MAAGVNWERLTATPERAVNFMKTVYAPGAASTGDGEMVHHEGYEHGIWFVHGTCARRPYDSAFELDRRRLRVSQITSMVAASRMAVFTRNDASLVTNGS